MSDDKQQSEQNRELPSTFSQLVVMIATSALQQLGQVPDPSGQRAEVNLEGAQGMIDILEALNEKTKGNLDEAEKKILDDSLTMLRMQYVEIKNASQGRPGEPQTDAPPKAEPAPQPESPPPAEGEGDQPIQPADSSGESKTRYRKSYG